MTKPTTKLLFSALLVSGLTIIMACQKEQNSTKLVSTNTNNTARLGDDYDLSKGDFRISMDTALNYVTRYRQKKEASGLRSGDYTAYYDVPVNGLVQLFAYAKKKGVELVKIRYYVGTKIIDGKPKETLVYVGEDASGNELYEESVTASRLSLNVYDEVDGCPPCKPNSSILNNNNLR